MASVPPIRAIWCAEPKDPAICGVLFLRVMHRRLTGPFAGLARVQEPGRPGETEDDCVRSQESRHGISTSAHANAAASATLANSPIRLNPSTSKASTVPFGLTKRRAIIPLA